jgi:hypothetical protein
MVKAQEAMRTASSPYSSTVLAYDEAMPQMVSRIFLLAVHLNFVIKRAEQKAHVWQQITAEQRREYYQSQGVQPGKQYFILLEVRTRVGHGLNCEAGTNTES